MEMQILLGGRNKGSLASKLLKKEDSESEAHYMPHGRKKFLSLNCLV